MEIEKLLNDEVLSLLELKEDMLFHKLSKDDIAYYIKESINIGKNLAKEYKDKNIENILKENNVEIKVEKDSLGKKDSIRAEIHFDKKTKEIKIYEDSINKMFNTVKDSSLKINKKKIYEIHLAHEFYHFLEFKDDNYTNNKLKKIVSISIGPLKRKSTILKTREIAAHAFCKELLNLKFHPKALDYIYLAKGNKDFEDKTIKLIKELKKEYLE
ncbi:hypothetical protein [Clostridium tertium]|uniref:Uncharacterized protein n=1 Tax=Clostridium tertium TaxID=1559 RepID=A0A6N3GUN1_9CLOT